MLTFKRSSLTYRYQQRYFNYLPLATNLCEYMLRIFTAFLIDLGITILVGLWLFFLIGVPIWAYFSDVSDAVIANSITVWSITILVGMYLAFLKFRDELKIKKQVDKVILEKEPQPNPFVEYIKAKKEKICPLIEFKD